MGARIGFIRKVYTVLSSIFKHLSSSTSGHCPHVFHFNDLSFVLHVSTSKHLANVCGLNYRIYCLNLYVLLQWRSNFSRRLDLRFSIHTSRIIYCELHLLSNRNAVGKLDSLYGGSNDFW